QTIIQLPTNSEAERWSKVVHSASYFLAAFSSPYGLVETTLGKLMLESAALFLDIKAGKSKTALIHQSELSVLWLLQLMLRESYGHEYFHRAIESALVDIDDSVVETEQKAVALFFLGTLAIELNDHSVFQ